MEKILNVSFNGRDLLGSGRNSTVFEGFFHHNKEVKEEVAVKRIFNGVTKVDATIWNKVCTSERIIRLHAVVENENATFQ